MLIHILITICNALTVFLGIATVRVTKAVYNSNLSKETKVVTTAFCVLVYDGYSFLHELLREMIFGVAAY